MVFNRLLGLTDGFYDEIRMLPMEEKQNDETSSHMNNDKQGKKFKRRKVYQDKKQLDLLCCLLFLKPSVNNYVVAN